MTINSNSMFINAIDPLILTQDQFIAYLAKNEITIGQPFTAPPIEVIDNAQFFDEIYRAADTYQNGLIYYVPRRA